MTTAKPHLCTVPGCTHAHDPAWVRPVSPVLVYAAAVGGRLGA